MRRLIACVLLVACACTSTPKKAARHDMTVTTAAFAPNGAIPEKYTCDGANASPDLSWSRAPDGTAEIAIVMLDVDMEGQFIHWLIYGIDPSVVRVGPGVVPPGAREGKNSLGSTGYRGPCPPTGSSHRYTFVVFALKRKTTLGRGATFAELDKTQAVFDRGEITGTYSRA